MHLGGGGGGGSTSEDIWGGGGGGMRIVSGSYVDDVDNNIQTAKKL